MAEKDAEIGLCHFLCWIKLGKLDFDFFNVGKSSECLMSKNTGSVQERTCADSARSRRFRIEFGIPNEIIRKYSETAWKFELCHFLGRKKCGNLNCGIFLCRKSLESWT